MKLSKQIKTLHINGEEWKYVIDRSGGYLGREIRIYDPNKRMHRVTSREFVEDYLGESYYDETRSIYQPSIVKEYIEKSILI